METVTIIAIVLSGISLAGSIVAPLVVAGALFINRIKSSDCFGGHLELDPSKQNIPLNQPIDLNTSKPDDPMKAITENLKNNSV